MINNNNFKYTDNEGYYIDEYDLFSRACNELTMSSYREKLKFNKSDDLVKLAILIILSGGDDKEEVPVTRRELIKTHKNLMRTYGLEDEYYINLDENEESFSVLRSRLNYNIDRTLRDLTDRCLISNTVGVMKVDYEDKHELVTEYDERAKFLFMINHDGTVDNKHLEKLSREGVKRVYRCLSFTILKEHINEYLEEYEQEIKLSLFKYFVYRFINKNNEIIYVGKTSNLTNRINTHLKSGHLDTEAYKETIRIEYQPLKSKIDMDIKELYYISLWKPKYNTRNKHDEDIAVEIKDGDKWKNFIHWNLR